MSNNLSVAQKEKRSIIYTTVVLLIFVLGILAFPLVRGLGLNLGYGDSQSVIAQAELLRARAELYQSLSTLANSLPPTIVETGISSLQVAVAITIILVAIGAVALVVSIAYSTIVSARIKEANAVKGSLPYPAGRPAEPMSGLVGDDLDSNRTTGSSVSGVSTYFANKLREFGHSFGGKRESSN